MRNGHNSLIVLALAVCATMVPSSAQAEAPDCHHTTEVSRASATPDPGDVLAATAAVVTGRDGSFVIWRAARKEWETGLTGSLLAPGDAICARSTSRVFVRHVIDGQTKTLSLPGGGEPMIIPGSRRKAPSADALQFLAGLDWPTASESAAIERALIRAASGRAPRQRSGATRGMSVGSTPRAVYLDPVTSLDDVASQTFVRGLDQYLWGWCGQDMEGIYSSENGVSGPLDPFVAIDRAEFGDASSIRLLGSGNSREFAVEWVGEKDLPRPGWMRGRTDPLLHALWLIAEGGGRYQAQGYSMLHALAGERPAALHYLAYLSNCGGGPTYAPELASAD